MQPISPYLTIKGAEKALEFYQRAFGATDIFRHPDEDGKRLFHARMTINGGTVMMSDDYSKDHGGPQRRLRSIRLRSRSPSPTIHPNGSTPRSVRLSRPARADPWSPLTCSGATASPSWSIRSATAGCSMRR